jgi:hypothetical protein
MTNPITTVVAGVREWLNQPTPRKQMLPAYLILTVGIVLGFSRFEALANQRADDLEAASVARALVACQARVESRDSLRSVLLGIADLFEESESVSKIVRLINSDYPAMNPDVECATAKLQTPED